MSLTLRFLDARTNVLIADTPAIKADITIGLNKTGEFNADIPINTEALQHVDKGNIVQVIYDGELLIEGTLQNYGQSLDDESVVTISGRDVMDELYRVRAVSHAYFDDQPFLEVLGYLLHQAGWVIGDISTLPDPTETVSLDLRNREYLVEQIADVIGTISKLAYRYGGEYVGGARALDIGFFGQTSFMQFVSAPSDIKVITDSQGVGFIKSLKKEVKLTDKVNILEAWGGEIQIATNPVTSNRRTIMLYDSINFNPNWRYDLTYPIREIWIPYQTAMYRRSAGLPGGGLLCWPFDPSPAFILYGDANLSAAVRQTNLLIEFLPVPGILTEYTIQYGANGGAPVGDTFYNIYETTPGTGVANGAALSSGQYTHVPSAKNRIILNTPVTIEWDKTYLLEFGFIANQADNVRATIEVYSSDDFTDSVKLFTFDRTVPTLTYSVNTPLIYFHTVRHEWDEGEEVTKHWTQYTPPRTGTDSIHARVIAAGSALYKRGRAYMDDRTGNNIKYTLEAVGREIVPQPGQEVYVHGQAEWAFTNPFTRTEETYRLVVQGNLRVEEIKISIEDDISYSYNLLDGNGVSNEDQYVSIYDATEPIPPPAGDVLVHIYTPEIATINASIPINTPFDTTMSDGREGLLVTFNLPSPPADKREVYLCGLPLLTLSNTDMTVEVVQMPVYASTPLIVRIAPRFRGWSYQDNADLTARIIWN